MRYLTCLFALLLAAGLGAADLPDAVRPLSHGRGILTLCHPPGSSELWMWGPDNTLRVWSLADWSLLGEREKAAAYVNGAVAGPAAAYTWGIDGRLRRWDLAARRVAAAVDTGSGASPWGNSSLAEVAVHAGTGLVAVAHARGVISVYEGETIKLRARWEGTRRGAGDASYFPEGSTKERDPGGRYVSSVDFSADGSVLASGGIDWALKLWTADGEALKVLPVTRRPLRRVRFVGDGSRVLAVDQDGRAMVWSIPAGDGDLAGRWRDGKPTVAEPAGFAAGNRIAIAPGGGALATIGPQGELAIYDLPAFAPRKIGPWQGLGKYVALCWLDDARLAVGWDLAGEGRSKVCTVLDATTGEPTDCAAGDDLLPRGPAE